MDRNLQTVLGKLLTALSEERVEYVLDKLQNEEEYTRLKRDYEECFAKTPSKEYCDYLFSVEKVFGERQLVEAKAAYKQGFNDAIRIFVKEILGY